MNAQRFALITAPVLG